jgi:hypothetical protein
VVFTYFNLDMLIVHNSNESIVGVDLSVALIILFCCIFRRKASVTKYK